MCSEKPSSKVTFVLHLKNGEYDEQRDNFEKA
jgi:hypothetical protein